jgi:predicted phosphodiesterase
MTKPDLDKLLTIGVNGAAADAVRGRKHKHPQGWEPISLGERGGYITSEPLAAAPDDWDALLTQLLPDGMDPADYEVDGQSVEVRAWDANTGEAGIQRLYYFKARIKRRTELSDVPLADIVAAAKKAKRPNLAQVITGRTYWLQVTDLQAGQADGQGVAGMVAKALELAHLAKDDLAQLKKCGRPAESIFIPITGDLVEGISGWYEMQTFSVALDRRDQVKLVRRLLTEMLLELRTTGLPIHVAVVPGNHGENRQNGKAFTTLSDNDDVAVVEQIAEAFALANLDGFTWSFPQRDRLSMTVEVQGWVIGLTHGHIARGGAGVEGKILGWFKSMAAAREPIGDADVLFTGHYHHHRFQNLIGNTEWVQGGALCDASAWFSQSFGLVSDPVVMKGTITREQRIEQVIPHRWPRTQTITKQI